MKKFPLYILLAASVASLSSCEDKLDIEQHGVLNYETYYQTDEEAQTAATAMYLEMRGNGMNYVLGKNMLTDDFWAGGGGRADNGDLEQLNEFTFGTDQGYLQGMFQAYYKIIYKANVILGHVSDDTDVKRRVIAEAKVFRAWSYFELISMWGNPPLVDHELAPDEYSKPNGTTEELWGLVEKDLTEAINSGYLLEKTSADDVLTWQVTKQFAQAILGKAYLWQGKNAEAADEFEKVITSGLYRLYDGPYEDVLSYNTKHNCESIFECNRVKDDNNPYDNFDMLYVMLNWRTDKLEGVTNANVIGSNGWGFVVPQKNLYDTFVALEGENGYRLNSTIKTYEQVKEMGITVKTGSTIINEGYFLWKVRYEPEAFGDFVGMIHHQNIRYMRYAEVLLLAAEANLAAGRTGKAEGYLNDIRTRAQLTPKSGITLRDIQDEKRCELCGESVRYQDLVRWGLAYERLKDQGKNCPILDSNGNVSYNVYNQDPSKFGFKQGKHELLPYPGAEIRLNPNIKQNPGW